MSDKLKSLKQRAKIQKSKLNPKKKPETSAMRNKLSTESAFELRFFERHGVWLSQLDDDEREEYLSASPLKHPTNEENQYHF